MAMFLVYHYMISNPGLIKNNIQMREYKDTLKLEHTIQEMEEKIKEIQAEERP